MTASDTTPPELARQRIVLTVRDRSEAITQARQYAAVLRAGGRNYAVLQMDAGWLSNLNVAHNLVLPACWQLGIAAGTLLKRASALAERWSHGEQWLSQQLGRRPSELTTAERRELLLLQAALCEPEVLLILPEWFSGPTEVSDLWWQMQNQYFDKYQWLHFAKHASPLLSDAQWQPGTLDAQGNIHVD